MTATSCVTACLTPVVASLPPLKFNPNAGIDQSAVYARCGHDPKVAAKLIFEPGGKAAPPKGYDKLAQTSLSDLPVASMEPIASQDALVRAFAARAEFITPFSLCDAADAVIFVECEADPSQGSGFYYLEQRGAAIAGFSVPYAMLPALADAVLSRSTTRVDLSKCVWLHSTGRCGSTLLSKVFDAMGGIQSLSEPDLFTNLISVYFEALSRGVDRAAALAPVVRASTLLLLHAQLRRRPEDEVVVVKTRSLVVRVHGPLLHAALPQMRAAFLYRNAVDYVDSACMAFLQQPVMRFLRKHRLDGAYIFGPKMTAAFEFTLPAADHARAAALLRQHPALAAQLGAVGALARGWMVDMSTAARLAGGGALACCLRYEDLCEQKYALAKTVLAHLGLNRRRSSAGGPAQGAAAVPDEDAVVPPPAPAPPRASEARVAAAFATEAHQGGNQQLASQKRAGGVLLAAGPLYFPQAEVAALERWMRLHDHLAVSDPRQRLPKTLA